MAEADPLRKYVEAGIAFTQLTKSRAEAIVRELVKAGDIQREQAQERVEELLDRSRRSTDGLVGIVRREIAQQLSSMGFATRDDLERFEARLESRLAAMAPKPGTPARKASEPASRPAAKPAKPASDPGGPPAGAAAKTATRSAGPVAAAPPGTAARKAAASPSRRRRAAGGKE